MLAELAAVLAELTPTAAAIWVSSYVAPATKLDTETSDPVCGGCLTRNESKSPVVVFVKGLFLI